jgi:hypothetical protein
MSLFCRDLALNGAWSRRWVLVAAGLMALSPLAGCSHHRSTSYRPIFARPTAGCSTCGGASMGGTTITTEPSTSVPSSTVTTPSIDSSVTPSSTFRGNSSGSVRSSTVERPPSAQIGPDPEYDAFSSGSSSSRNSAKVPGAGSPPAPASPGASAGPTLLGPTTDTGNASTMLDNQGASDARLTSRAAARRAANSAQRDDNVAAELQPYIAGTSASELFYPAKADRPWHYIVLHHSASAAGNYDEIDREHRKQLGYDGCGYHFIIGNGNGSGDGQIEVARRWDNQKQGVHCRNARSHDVDEYGIGICLIGDLDQQPPTPRQIAATRALIAYLSRRYQIATSNISTHAHLAATPTACPGKYFPEALAGAKIDGRDAG